MTRSQVFLVFASTTLVASSTARATDPGPKKLPNGTGDGYADFAPDAYGAFTSSECGGGFNADGSVKALGAAEFDPYNPALTVARPRGGVVCNTRIHLFSPDGTTPPVRQILAAGPIGWSGSTTSYPDGTPFAPGIRPADLVSDTWQGPNQSVRRTRYYPHLFPGLQVDLDQRASCAALTQVYRFTNVGATTLSFRLTQTSDTDLSFGSNFVNNWGRLDPADPFTSYVYNNAKDVALMMRARVDFDTTFEGWRVKVQNSAGYDLLREGMYYGFPTRYGTPVSGHEIARCLTNPSGANCPTPNHLNKIFRAQSGSNPDAYGISPDFGASVELDGDLTGGPGNTPDGWSDIKWDIAQTLQSLYVIAPGESREYRTLYEGIPSYCHLQVDAGYDSVVAVASASACATTVALAGDRSVVSGGGASAVTYTWYDAWGAQVATGVNAVVNVVGAGEHRFDLKVCNGDGICDVDFVAVIARDADGSCADTDGDGVVDALDRDDDDDGIPDSDEALADTDGDGLDDGHDLDSDGDHVPDLLEGDDDLGVGATAREAIVDANRDGQVDHLTRVDEDDDGWDDRFQSDPPSLPDFDVDGLPDVVDADDDADRIPTALECPDGRPCPASALGQPDYLDVRRYACSALHVASAGSWLGAGGLTMGDWQAGTTAIGAVARDGWSGHLYLVDGAGLLWRATPGAVALIGDTHLGANVVGLAAAPAPGVLVAVVAGASTSTFYQLSLADASAVAQDTVDGVVGDVAYDAAGGRVFTRVLGAANQLVRPGDLVTALASPVYGLAVQPSGTLLGLTVVSGSLRVNSINATSGALTSLFEPTRSWRPALTPSAPYDLAQCPANLAPELAPDYVVTPFGQPIAVHPLANDGDRDGALILTTFSHGAADQPSAQLVDGAPGDVTATPPSGWVGPFGFDYGIADDDGIRATSRATVFVAPDAQPDAVARAQGDGPAALDLAANDASHPSAATFALAEGAPVWVSLGPDGVLTVAPPDAVAGTFSFDYDDCYATGLDAPAPTRVCDRATVTVAINARPTLAAAADATVIDGPPVGLDVATLYADPDGDELDPTSLSVAAAPGCALTVTRDGTHLSATPSGTIEVCVISITACDAAAEPACATTTWTVTVADLPCGGIPSDQLVEQCDGADDNCDGRTDEYYDTDCGPGPVYYAIVEDAHGVPVGTVRCFVRGQTLDCDREPAAPDELLVYPALLCPGAAPTQP